MVLFLVSHASIVINGLHQGLHYRSTECGIIKNLQLINSGPFARLTCKNCGKIFSSLATLSRHQIWHHKCPDDVFKYNCSLCPYATNHTNRFKSHKLVHNPDRQFICIECDMTCRTCGKWFTSKQTLVKHRMWHHKSEYPPFKFNCNKCPYASNAKSSLVTHELVHSEDRAFKCEFCGNRFKALRNYCKTCDKWFPSHALLSKHKLWHHKSECPRYRYNCRMCPYASNDMFALFVLNGYVCSVCSKWFSTHSTLNTHKIWHHKSEFPPFKFCCTKCPYATNKCSSMKSHVAVHLPGRPFICKQCGNDVICGTCGKWFTTNCTLLKHRLWHHKSELQPFRFNCDKCPYASNVKSSMTTHAQVHSANRAFRCQFCKNGFTTLRSLSNHVVIHTGEKPVITWLQEQAVDVRKESVVAKVL
ncbi:Zinc finger protein 676 like protein [Argiope bruennichi]|uniref:Zinc finger protein 676 like protein n=1 Tax=Argiope bruennichi TaxID=94029 RepID=A0A8T0FTZ4_ARGBR|nr:Zinc finger protein 676 like protein [Argiope bruennichi]